MNASNALVSAVCGSNCSGTSTHRIPSTSDDDHTPACSDSPHARAAASAACSLPPSSVSHEGYPRPLLPNAPWEGSRAADEDECWRVCWHRRRRRSCRGDGGFSENGEIGGGLSEDKCAGLLAALPDEMIAAIIAALPIAALLRFTRVRVPFSRPAGE